MTKAKARHILVETEAECLALKDKINNFEEFDQLAREHSMCPSGRVGGDLGIFGPGKMVPEFDDVVFNAEIGKIQGPVLTQFGYHLIWITARK
ncbi:peptidylprolyl isomerase [Hydrogenovibrio sp. 3SP14C1]|uniref:peptidylprolyl isomerase n=1 Tax=Hydrogenovibrio sp. 3SP14C1 TaxID=3038774 RepID=UPI002416F269|nr:peptidylprolyl isomerase [Hydrogenovibrio sp. 3SP14C1]MDG4812166.1 peptidylprolyl isomerase [Hydrogenovibrio sp. 3SP14C1]